MKTLLSTMVFLAVLASPAAALTPSNATDEQRRLAKEWAEYSTACRGGAVDRSQETTWGYCGTAEYIAYRLAETGLCFEYAQNGFVACNAADAKYPLDGYPF